ncbi:MAG: cytochrome c biogenesis protein CcsA [Bacteroidales bacterium]|nr:cytochrome c biogenesis protein CcsA [Bacteroidales bacterium]
MLKRISFLFSMSFMGVLLIILIGILALATLIESRYGTETAWALIYGTHLFEILLLLIGINVVGAVVLFRSYRRPKISVFLFHLSFVLILAGAGITRFISSEGMMHIREGESASSMISDDAWMKVDLRSGDQAVAGIRNTRLTELTGRSYRSRMRIGKERVVIRSTGFIPNAVEQMVPMPGGEPFVQLIALSGRQVPVGIPSGETRNLFGMEVSLNAQDPMAMLRLFSEGERLYGTVPFSATAMKMGESAVVSYEPFDTIPFEQGMLYAFGHLRLALQAFYPSAKPRLTRAPDGQGMGYPDAVELEIAYRGMVARQVVTGSSGATGNPVTGRIGDLEYTITYGSREIPLPFKLALQDFRVERYPGSNSPSSFISEVTLLDGEMGIEEDCRIYMNNVLKHRGYRFYQSSYDTDEMGTILSVNKDRWGTGVTYAGYFLLMAGMVLALFNRGTRFQSLVRNASGALRRTAAASLLLLALPGAALTAQPIAPPKDIASQFGTLWVQGKEGRFKPVNTLSGEVVRKITGKSKYRDYTPDQVLLGMLLYPEEWREEPLFKVDQPEIRNMIGYMGKRACFYDFIEPSGSGYLLSDIVDRAYSKPVAARDDLDKEVIKLDDRINAMILLQTGELLRIFPAAETENNRWNAVPEALAAEPEAHDSAGNAFMSLLLHIHEGDYSAATEHLNRLKDYQSRHASLLPAEGKKRMEILYNRINIFPRLSRFYGIFGLLLLVLQFIRTFRVSKLVDYLFRVGVIHLAVAFGLHTLAFIARWYISGHAPLSNGYESMIFVSWVTLLAGLFFVRWSGFAMGLTAVLGSLSLVVAHMSWMNPEITNLVPVLKSVWLTIHVTVVMAGYGFLGLASLLGLTGLVFLAVLNEANHVKISGVVEHLTRVNQMALIIGLYFMTAGVFLGGVWANESWGRYWGWDPKETWALITVLVYAFVAHMRHIPGLRGAYAYNLASFFGYGSVLMTYFGVNYFLGGIHSYATGSPFAFPWYSYAILAILAGLSIVAWYRQKRVPDIKEIGS